MTVPPADAPPDVPRRRRTDLPSGTVTFVFTDIAGSTRLLQDLGDVAYADLLARHRAAIRSITAARGGAEVDTQGDAFFLVFPTADAAIAAADGISRIDVGGAPVAVRIGAHSGTALLTDEGYVGDEVHLAARIAAAAHGGQVVLSAASRALLPADLPTTDLGEHRLKDFARAVAIHQLGTATFPPLRSLSGSNLPTPVSAFLGRADDVRAVRERLVDRGARIVTLTGPGGIGKTRLAIEAARAALEAFPAGAWWVSLAPLEDAGLVLPTIAGTLGAVPDLAAHIGSRRMLLVLDNLEQVVDAGPRLAELLTACPALALLVTSRITLRVPGEVEHRLDGLAPDEAIALFTERSGIAASPVIEELCRRLDRLPLAIELAAARARALGPDAVLQRLGSRLDLLKGARELDGRQRTLRATIAWSDGLLDDEARRLFRRLAVFPGGCSLEAAEEVLGADLDVLATLVEHSLVRQTDGRFWMLETIRAYADDALASDPGRHGVEQAFLRWALDLAERSDARIRGPNQAAVLDEMDTEIDNIRAAFSLAAATDEPDVARRFALATAWFLNRRGFGAETREWAQIALSRPGRDPGVEGWIVYAAASPDWDVARTPESLAALERATELAREAGDERLEATVIEVRGFIDDSPAGRELIEAAAGILRRRGDRDALARNRINLAARYLNDDEPALALEASAEALALAETGGNAHGIGMVHANAAAALALLGRMPEAAERLVAAHHAFDQVGERFGYVFLLETAAVTLVADPPDPLVAVLVASAREGYRRYAQSLEPVDSRLYALVEPALASLDAGVRSAALAEGASLEPAGAFRRWLERRPA